MHVINIQNLTRDYGAGKEYSTYPFKCERARPLDFWVRTVPVRLQQSVI